MNTQDFITNILRNEREYQSISVPPLAEGQKAKSYLLEDLRFFLCTAISTDLKKKEKSSKPIHDEKIVKELILYYHIIGYSDNAAMEKIVSILDRKEVWNGE